MSERSEAIDAADRKRIFHVTATLEIDLVVLAKNERDAEMVGVEHWLDEVHEAALAPDKFVAIEVTRRHQLDWFGPDNLVASSPYGREDQESPQLTIHEYLQSLQIK